MKRFFCVLLCLTLALSLWGCVRERPDESNFFYCRTKMRYDGESGVPVCEKRDTMGHEGNLQHLIPLYLMGPLGEGLESPFPEGTHLEKVKQAAGTVYVELSGIDEGFSDSRFTLACACLTLTCLDLTDAVAVSVTDGTRTLTMDRASLILRDPVPMDTKGE